MLKNKESNSSNFADKYRNFIWILIIVFGVGVSYASVKTQYELVYIAEKLDGVDSNEERIKELEMEKRADVLRWEHVKTQLEEIKDALKEME